MLWLNLPHNCHDHIFLLQPDLKVYDFGYFSWKVSELVIFDFLAKNRFLGNIWVFPNLPKQPLASFLETPHSTLNFFSSMSLKILGGRVYWTQQCTDGLD